MGYSKVKIFNLALNRLGVSSAIQSNTQEDPRAILLNNVYELSRDEVLEAHDWSFANAYREISASTESSPDPNYLYALTLPEDCIAPRALIDIGDKQEKKFEPAIGSNNQKIILTNTNPAILRYTKRITNESLFTAGFVRALSYKLAAETGYSITGSREKEEINERRYEATLVRSIIFDARKSEPHDQDDNDFTDSRY